jgi:hypothetical protein
MNDHLSKTLPSLVEHLHRKTGILKIYFWSTQGRRHLAPGGFSRFTSSGGGGGTSSGSAGGGGGTSSLPRFLDGSLDAMRLLEEGESLGFTSW